MNLRCGKFFYFNTVKITQKDEICRTSDSIIRSGPNEKADSKTKQNGPCASHALRTGIMASLNSADQF